ncbi:hypothetical protein Q9L58_009207 [Maublancomyces gigas]|uniref:Uncharacterized protein n=1 Tax=Discina gigas TaxID=1032678 RepID=A0ABR3G7J6_9PEZI
MTALNLAAGLLSHLRSGWHRGYYGAGDIRRRTGTRELLHRREVLGAETDNAKRLCTSRRVIAARRLLQSGAGTEMGCGIGRTALHVAAINCDAHTALVLLDGGANRKAKTAIREMALHLAVLGRSVSSILALLLRYCDCGRDYDAGSCCLRLPRGGYRGHTLP